MLFSMRRHFSPDGCFEIKNAKKRKRAREEWKRSNNFLLNFTWYWMNLLRLSLLFHVPLSIRIFFFLLLEILVDSNKLYQGVNLKSSNSAIGGSIHDVFFFNELTIINGDCKWHVQSPRLFIIYLVKFFMLKLQYYKERNELLIWEFLFQEKWNLNVILYCVHLSYGVHILSQSQNAFLLKKCPLKNIHKDMKA